MQQQLILIDKSELDSLKTDIAEIKLLLLNQSVKPIKKTKAEEDLDSLKLYIPLHKAWAEMGITKDQWYKIYKGIIQWKKYRGSVWVYAPSIKKFFEEKNVNKRL